MIKVIFSTLFFFGIFYGYAQEARLYRQNDKVGLLNTESKPITKAIYDQILPGTPYSVVKKYDAAKARYVTGCVDASGEEVIPLVYTDLKVEGLRIIACVKNQHGFVYGVLTLKNEVVIPIQYKSVTALGTLRFAVENLEGKIALYAESGTALTGFEIDKLYPFQNDVCVYEQNGLVGLLSRNGEIKSKAEYRSIVRQPNGTWLAQKPNVWQWITNGNEVQRTIATDSLFLLSNGNSVLSDRRGFVVADKEMIPVSQYYSRLQVSSASDLLFAQKQKKGVISTGGKEIVACVYDSVLIGEHHIFTKSIQGWRVFSHSGEITSNRYYDELQEKDQYIYVKKNGYWGVMDSSGREILACVYDQILNNNDRQFSVQFKGQYGVLSTEEQWLVPLQSFPIQVVNDTHYIIVEGTLYTVRNFQHEVVYFTNNELSLVSDGFREATSTGELWHVSWTGVVTKIVETPMLLVTSVEPEHEGYRAVYKDGKWGFVDARGRLRIPNRYDKVKHFSEGLAPFSLRKKWGFINKEDEIVFHPLYDDAEPFVDGLSRVMQKGKYGLIDKENQLVLPCRYDSIRKNTHGFFELVRDHQYGLADNKGSIVYEPKYSFQHVSTTSVVVGRDGKFGVLDLQGLNILPMNYETIVPTEVNDFLCFRKGETTVLVP